MIRSLLLPKIIFLFFLFISPHLNLLIFADLLGKIGVEDSKMIGGNIGDEHEEKQLPICRVCTCNRRLRTVQCVPRRQGGGGLGGDGQFRLRMIRLPHWADTFVGLNLSQPEFPHFASHPGLRQIRLLHSQLFSLHPLSFAPLPGLELIQLADNALEQFPVAELLQPLGHLRTLDLSGNRLRDLWLPSWNEAMGNMRVLDRLVLDRNPLCPYAGSEWPQTKQLHLAKTGMREMNSTHFTFQQPDSPPQCSFRINPMQWNTLEELHLDGNSLLQISLDAIKPLAQLRLLKLSQAIIPEQFFLDFPGRDQAKWQHLDLNGVQVESAPTFEYVPFGHIPVQIGRGLRGHQVQWKFCTPEMEWLDIGGMGLEGELSLGGCKQLKWFYGDGNGLDGIHLGDGLGPVGLLSVSLRSNRLRHLPSAFLAASQSLVSLQLANNSIRHLPDEGRLLMGQFPRLQHLDLAENKLRHFELEPFSSTGHHYSPQLLTLNLSHNQIHQFHIASRLESLTILDLTGNELKAIELAEILRLLPSLEHLHLAQNEGIQFIEGDTVMDANSALVQLDLANCSLAMLPDLSRLYALRELNAQGNRLHQVPAQLIPREGLMLLDLRGNSIQRFGWDWSEAQLSSLHQLRLQANPLDCGCPMPQQLATRLERLVDGNIVGPIFEDHSGYVCIEDPATAWANHGIGHWQHPLDAFLFPADPHGPHPNPGQLLTAQKHQQKHHLLGDCPSPVVTNLFHAGGGPLPNAAQISMEQQDPSLFALFLLPVLLIAGSLAVGLLLLRGSPKWQELHWAHTEAGSMLAYEQLHAEQMADSV